MGEAAAQAFKAARKAGVPKAAALESGRIASEGSRAVMSSEPWKQMMAAMVDAYKEARKRGLSPAAAAVAAKAAAKGGCAGVPAKEVKAAAKAAAAAYDCAV